MSRPARPVVHFEIGCRDKAETGAFFEAVFGWKLTDRGPSTDIDTGSDRGIPGHINSLGHEPHQYVTVYVEVDDVAAALDAVKDQGGEHVVGPIDLPDGRIFAWFRDPGGNLMGMITALP